MSLINWLRQESDKIKAWHKSRGRVEKVPWEEMEDGRVSNKSPTILAKIHQRTRQSEEAIFVGLIVFMVGLFIFFYGLYLVNQLYQKDKIINKQQQVVAKYKHNNTALKNKLIDRNRALLVKDDELTMYKNAFNLRKFYKVEAERYKKQLKEAKNDGK